MPTRLRIAARTDAGPRRALDEDSFLVADLATGTLGVAPAPFSADLSSDAGFALVVTDGMGGRDAGEVASSMAIAAIGAALGAAPLPHGAEERRGRMIAVMSAAAGAIFERSSRERSMMGAGACALLALLDGDRLYLATAGDDALALVLRAGRLVRVTPTFSRIDGPPRELDLDALVVFQDLVTRSMPLGAHETASPMTSTITLRAGDVLLLCTDGLTDVVPRESIVEVLNRITDPSEACLALVNLAVNWGGPDNITVLVARPEGAALRPPSVEDELHEAEHHHI